MGVDQNETFRGKPTGYIKSRETPRGFWHVNADVQSKSYLSNRVKLTGKAKSVAVEKWAGFWMRVDGPSKQTLSFDNMQQRPSPVAPLAQILAAIDGVFHLSPTR